MSVPHPSSRHFCPHLNHKIRNAAMVRLRLCSIDQVKSAINQGAISHDLFTSKLLAVTAKAATRPPFAVSKTNQPAFIFSSLLPWAHGQVSLREWHQRVEKKTPEWPVPEF
jgi:hypothetical protein